MRFLKVTSTTIYAFENGSINGWSPEKVAEDWFENYHPDQTHVSRDGHQLGNSTVVQKVETLNEKQFKEYAKEIDAQAEKISEKRKPKLWSGGESLEWPINKVLEFEGD